MKKIERKFDELTWYKGVVIYTDGYECAIYGDDDNLITFRTLSQCKRFITHNF